MVNRKEGESAHTPVVIRDMDGYRVHALDDGGDYMELARRFSRGEISGKRLNNSGKHRREVYLVEAGGRRYVIKTDSDPGSEWAQKLWQVVLGPRDSRLMKRVNRAVDAGCDVVPRTLLVAEKFRGLLVTRTLTIIEYVEGRTVDLKNDPPGVRQEVAAALNRLYAHRLAHTDISPNNFVVSESGIKIIDLTFRGTFFVGRLKGIARLKKRFGVDIPLRGAADRSVFLLLRAKEKWNSVWRRFGRRLKALIKGE